MAAESEINNVGRYIQRKLRKLPENHPDRPFLAGLHTAVEDYQHDVSDQGQGGIVVYESPPPLTAIEKLATKINSVGQTLPDTAIIVDLINYNTAQVEEPYPYPQWQNLMHQLPGPERSKIIRPLSLLGREQRLHPKNEPLFETVGDIRTATLARLVDLDRIGPNGAVLLQKSFSVPKPLK